MEDYESKRATPLLEYTFNEISHNLSSWRDNLRKELEILIYIKNCLPSNENNEFNSDSKSQENKIKSIIPKLEALCLKEIDCINEFFTSSGEKMYTEKSEHLYSKIESIRENYNKIIVNIQKMINTVPLLKEYRLKYQKTIIPKEKDIKTISQHDDINHLSPSPYKKGNEYHKIKHVNKKPNQHYDKLNKTAVNPTIREKNTNDWIQKLNRDLDELNKHEITMAFTRKDSYKINNEDNKSNTSSRNNSKHKTKEKRPKQLVRPTTPLFINKKPQFFSTVNNIASNLKQREDIHNNTKEKEAIKFLAEEIKLIKSHYTHLNKTLTEHCLFTNEKREFDQLKKENIKLVADVIILKEDMNELIKNQKNMMTQMTEIQIQNDQLKQQNQCLIAYISSLNINGYNTSIPVKQYNNCTDSNDLMFSNTIQESNISINTNIMNQISKQISDLSTLNQNINSKKNDYDNANEFNRTYGDYSSSEKNITNLNVLTKDNNNSRLSTTPIHQKQIRYLIPKSSE